jgi:hypothetical protein
MQDLKRLQSYAFDKPVKYKDLLVYPALMEDYIEFYIMVDCLTLEKNLTLEGISKTYLEYLFFLENAKDDGHHLLRFESLLRLCLRKKDLTIDYGYDSNKKAAFKIEDKMYDSGDFDELRLLICEQNAIELPDETIQKEIRDSMDEAVRMRMKQSGTIPPTLEDQVVCVMVSTSLTLDDIAKLSIRKFGQLLERADWKLHYQIYLTASASGFVEFKDKSILKHWMSGKEINKFKDTMISIEDLGNKLGNSAQENKT